MPNWAGSCWYYLNYLEPGERDVVVDPELERYWLGPGHNASVGASGGVDLYVGGVEHAVLHLLYAGYGADTFRVYEMSMGPLDLSRPWDTRAVVGSQRFLQRLWRQVVDEETGDVTVVDAEPDTETVRLLHRTIDEVRTEMDAMRFNTAIARLIVLNNHLTSVASVPRSVAEPLVLMVAPFAPHIAEELWSRLGHDHTLLREAFPVADPVHLVEETVTCIVQVQGKVRDKLEVSPDVTEDALREMARASERVQRTLAGRDVRTVIVRAPRLVNVVPV